MNSCTFAGRIGKDAVLRTTPNGDVVLGFSVAVDERRGQEKTTLWIDCSLWGKRAEALAPYLGKGQSVCVSGQIGTRTHEGKAYLTLRVSEVTLLGQRQQAEHTPRASTSSASSTEAAAQGAFVDDDIPF